MLVIYTGPDAGHRLAPSIGDVWCPRGEAVDVPDHVGERLCERPDFEPARRRKRRTETAPDPRSGTETPESHDPTMEARHHGPKST